MICAVHGYCIFGGWMVASTADIIFASDDALFLGSAFQYFSIPYDIHHRKAKEYPVPEQVHRRPAGEGDGLRQPRRAARTD